ncbi:MAG: hypothetical protein AAB426_00750, partial [Myxococcota bacterium]
YPDIEPQWVGQGRNGAMGVRKDTAGNIYVAWAAAPSSSGLGHSSQLTHTRLTKYDPVGGRLWEVGQKAMGARHDGEIYNTWTLAGTLGDQYVAIADEGGLIHFYTTDGFYRGHLFQDPGRPTTPGPFTFVGGELFSGRVVQDPASGRVYAYENTLAGYAYEVKGLGGEVRAEGEVEVTADEIAAASRREPEPGDGAIGPMAAGTDIGVGRRQWSVLTPFSIRSGADTVGEVWVGFSDSALLARFEVDDNTPWTNSLERPWEAFKTGDGVDLYVGPPGERSQPVLGDTRLLIVPDGVGGAQVIGMKPLTAGTQQPQTYATAMTRQFQWVGVVPGANARVTPLTQSYTVEVSIPLSFFEGLTFQTGERLRFDADVLVSDGSETAPATATQQRIFVFSSGPEASIVADVPTEAWLYPALWHEVTLAGPPPTGALETGWSAFNPACSNTQDVHFTDPWHGVLIGSPHDPVLFSSAHAYPIRWTQDGGSTWHEASADVAVESFWHDSARNVDVQSYALDAAWFSTRSVGWIAGRLLAVGATPAEFLLLRTHDGGRTWSGVAGASSPDVGYPVRRLWFDEDGRRAWLVPLLTGSTIWRTEDGGVNWTAVAIPHNFYDAGLYVSTFDHLTLVGGSGSDGVALASDDAGAHWTSVVATALEPTGGWLRGVHFSPDGALGVAIGGEGGIVVGGGWQQLAHAVVLRTTDGGTSWERVPLPSVGPPLTDVFVVSASEAWVGTFYGYSFDPVLSPMLWHTEDGGTTWQDETPAGISIRRIFFLSSARGWIVGGQGGSSFEPAGAGMRYVHD